MRLGGVHLLHVSGCMYPNPTASRLQTSQSSQVVPLPNSSPHQARGGLSSLTNLVFNVCLGNKYLYIFFNFLIKYVEWSKQRPSIVLSFQVKVQSGRIWTNV